MIEIGKLKGNIISFKKIIPNMFSITEINNEVIKSYDEIKGKENFECFCNIPDHSPYHFINANYKDMNYFLLHHNSISHGINESILMIYAKFNF